MTTKKNTLILWVVFFCYALCIALIFQKLILPLIPSLNAKGGILPNDVAYFNSVAVTLSEQIRDHGWTSWKLFPANGVPGIVGILGALYFVFGYDPALIVPFNAAIHALSGVLIFLIINKLTDNKRAGVWAGLVVSSLYILFPSALSWYGQIHKDTYSIAGMLLILYVWLTGFTSISHLQNVKSFLYLFVLNISGILLILLVRPFLLKLLLVPAAVFLVATLIKSINLRKTQRYSIFFFLVVIFSLVFSISSQKTLSKEGFIPSGEGYSEWKPSEDQPSIESSVDIKRLESIKLWEWKNSPLLPDVIEKYIETAAKTRVGLIEYGLNVKAKSMIDIESNPENLVSVISYLPRAFQIAVLAPFPNSWLAEKSPARLVTSLEMFIYYLFLPGLFFLFKYNRKLSVFLTFFFASFFLLVYGFTQANLGTLYRYRYGYFFVIFALSGLGWSLLFDRIGWLQKAEKLFLGNKHPAQKFEKATRQQATSSRKKAINDGFFVMFFTLISFLGFFIRDMLMAQKFGIGHALDNFFVALLIPMFFVTVLCIPLGSAFVPVFSEYQQKVRSGIKLNRLIASLSGYSVVILSLICLAVFILSTQSTSTFNFLNRQVDSQELFALLNIGLFILLFSGMVVLGNALLTIQGHAVYSSAVQLVVPIIAITVVIFLGNAYGAKPVMGAMLIGQLLNLIFVQIKLKRNGFSLFPSFEPIDRLFTLDLLKQYLPLIASAFFVTAATTADTFLALTLPEGAVSAFNLGNKVVLFVIGILGAGISSVMLPYFSGLLSNNKVLEAQHELSIFMLTATLLSLPFTLIIFVWSEPLSHLIYASGVTDDGQINLISRVMQYAVIQIPFFVCSILLLKFATASKQTLSVVFVALLGLVINIVASYILMQRMGVGGIALGSTLATIISTFAILLLLSKSGHIFGFDFLVVCLGWMLFITLLISIHFNSGAGALFAGATYLLLLGAYIKTIFLGKLHLSHA